MDVVLTADKHRMVIHVGDNTFVPAVLDSTLKMCHRVLPACTAVNLSTIEFQVDNPMQQQEQIRIVQTILQDQIARYKLQSSHQAEIDAEVIRIVKQVSGVSGVRHA